MKVGSDEFEKYLRKKKEDVLNKTEGGIINADNFKRLRGILESFSDKYNPLSSFCILIFNTNIESLQFDDVLLNLYGPVLKQLQTHNIVEVNNKFEVVNFNNHFVQDTHEARKFYLALSKDNKCVIYISNEGVHTFFNGDEYGKNLFLTDVDYKTYSRKKDISEIDDVLKEYKIKIKERDAYSKFFVPKTTLLRIFGKDNYKKSRNLLRNKPELILRDDLQYFLSEKIKGTFNFSKEHHLNSDKRIDINTEDSFGNYYFFEIKWMGKSIGPDDNKIETAYDEKDIKQGVNQTLRYIKELKQSRKTVKFGCLTVFDARDDKAEVAFAPYDYLEDGLEKYLVHFRTRADLYISNNKPR